MDNKLKRRAADRILTLISKLQELMDIERAEDENLAPLGAESFLQTSMDKYTELST